jgi:pimeloyl-ACP methyl ester carboxylesterase
LSSGPTLAFNRFGDGPPLLILHGLLGSSRNWQGIGKQLGRRFGVLTVDLRNHGRSPWSEEMTYPAMAADLAQLIEAEIGGAVGIVGHSMGGKAAMALALMWPELVERLVVADIAPVTYSHSFSGYLAAMQAIDPAGIDRAAADRALASTIPEPPIRAFLLQNLEREGPGLRWRPNLAVLDREQAAILGFPEHLLGERYHGPCLVIRGGTSGYVRPEHEPLIRQIFPAARIVTIEGAGHWVHVEAPVEFTRLVTQFMSGETAEE